MGAITTKYSGFTDKEITKPRPEELKISSPGMEFLSLKHGSFDERKGSL
jgi:hypothetical protein